MIRLATFLAAAFITAVAIGGENSCRSGPPRDPTDFGKGCGLDRTCHNQSGNSRSGPLRDPTDFSRTGLDRTYHDRPGTSGGFASGGGRDGFGLGRTYDRANTEACLGAVDANLRCITRQEEFANSLVALGTSVLIEGPAKGVIGGFVLGGTPGVVPGIVAGQVDGLVDSAPAVVRGAAEAHRACRALGAEPFSACSSRGGAMSSRGTNIDPSPFGLPKW